MTEASAPPRRQRVPRTTTVVRTERVTPHLARVVLGGEALAGFDPSPHTDAYVKLVLPAPGGSTGADGADAETVLRTYTVRSFDAGRLELTLDVVVHGDEGVAGPWAAAVRPGDTVEILGPGGGYAPDAGADWHLLVGDDSALPAIAASLERLPAGVPALVFLEVGSPEEQLPLPTPADARVVWVHRSTADGVPGQALVDAVVGARFPDGDVHAFVHGEAGAVRALRRHLRLERGVPAERMSVSGYWRLGRTDEGWRADKAEWKRAVEQDEQALVPPAGQAGQAG